MCQVHAGSHGSLLAPGKTEKDYHVDYILHVSLRTGTTDASQLQKRNKGKKIKERHWERRENCTTAI